MIGQVFTPVAWARWALETHGVVDAWLAGARVLDPTAGDGSFIEALLLAARERGVAAPVDRLFAIETDGALVTEMRARLRRKYGKDLLDANVINGDVFDPAIQIECDVLCGNPPWLNFPGLPVAEKERLRPFFRAEGLVSTGPVLWGDSRVDLAALVVRHTTKRFLRQGGKAVFFLPLSLYLNDGASRRFRATIDCALTSIHDFRTQRVFENVSTRYGLCAFEKGAQQHWPVDYSVDDSGEWKRLVAAEGGLHGPLVIAPSPKELPRVAAGAATPKPRQGINTAGASDVFILDHATMGELPPELVYPLVTAEAFEDGPARRWILVPHDRVTGKPLSPEAVERAPSLASYLRVHEARLRGRRGPMLRRFIDSGLWWALLGVGPYAFTPFKVLWRAYGATSFRPTILDGRWQGNQAMHAYLPANDRGEAESLLTRLESLEVDRHFSRREGTRSFAQPGAMARLLGCAERS